VALRRDLWWPKCGYGCSASSKRSTRACRVPVRGAKQRALLALQAQMGQLRRTLGTAAVITAEAG